jgi:hypothetical protein
MAPMQIASHPFKDDKQGRSANVSAFFLSLQQGVYRYKQNHGHARSFAQRRRAADKRESTSGLRNRSFFWPVF